MSADFLEKLNRYIVLELERNHILDDTNEDRRRTSDKFRAEIHNLWRELEKYEHQTGSTWWEQRHELHALESQASSLTDPCSHDALASWTHLQEWKELQSYLEELFAGGVAWIYTLELDDGCYYVGQTPSPTWRFHVHYSGYGARWTELHRPKKFLSCIPFEEGSAIQKENAVTLEMMRTYGWKQVRGGVWTDPDPDKTQASLRKLPAFPAKRLEFKSAPLPAEQPTWIDTARAYVSQGIRLIPLWTPYFHWSRDRWTCGCNKGLECPSPGRHPRVVSFDLASYESVQIEAWAKRWAKTNIGVVAGPTARPDRRLIILDFDFGSEEQEAAWRASHPALPTTVEHQTARGTHVLLWAPPHFESVNGRLEGLSIDVKNKGTSLVLMPTSRHKSGILYTSKPGRSITEIEVAWAPKWLLEAMERVGSGSKSAAARALEPPSGQPNRADQPIDLSPEEAASVSDERVGWLISQLPWHQQNIVNVGCYKGSSHSQSSTVLTSLVRLGATNQEIKAIFDRRPIGDKSFDYTTYLERIIPIQRAFVAANTLTSATREYEWHRVRIVRVGSIERMASVRRCSLELIDLDTSQRVEPRLRFWLRHGGRYEELFRACGLEHVKPDEFERVCTQLVNRTMRVGLDRRREGNVYARLEVLQ